MLIITTFYFYYCIAFLLCAQLIDAFVSQSVARKHFIKATFVSRCCPYQIYPSDTGLLGYAGLHTLSQGQV